MTVAVSTRKTPVVVLLSFFLEIHFGRSPAKECLPARVPKVDGGQSRLELPGDPIQPFGERRGVVVEVGQPEV